MLLTATSLTDLNGIAQQIIDFAAGERIFLFYGDMGAGKTTLIKQLCAVLGVGENVTSPTFAIINEYRADKSRIYHFDFYRLKTQTEAMDMGYEEYFYSGDYCFIEWPTMIPDLLPANYIKITIAAQADQSRSVIVTKI